MKSWPHPGSRLARFWTGAQAPHGRRRREQSLPAGPDRGEPVPDGPGCPESASDLDVRFARLDRALRDLHDAWRDDLAAAVTQMGRAAELHALMENAPVAARELAVLVRQVGRLPEQFPDLLRALVERETGQLLAMVQDLAQRDIVRYDGEDRDWLLALTESARATIDSISLETTDSRHGLDRGFWERDLGERYLMAQHQGVVRRGLKVRRVFISDRPGFARDPTFLATFRRHESRGVQARVLEWARIPESRRDDVADFTVFDAAVGYHVAPTSVVVAGTNGQKAGPPVRLRTELRIGPDKVASSLALIDFLWELASGPPPGPGAGR